MLSFNPLTTFVNELIGFCGDCYFCVSSHLKSAFENFRRATVATVYLSLNVICVTSYTAHANSQPQEATKAERDS